MPLPQVIVDLAAVLSRTPLPTHVRRLCSSLLSKSLLRNKGINALFSAIFRQDSPDEPSLEMYEHVGRILMTIPAGKKPEVRSSLAFAGRDSIYYAVGVLRLYSP